MTQAAKELRNAVVQTIRARFQNPLYHILLYEYGGREMHKHQMMILGSVLLPPEPTPEPTEEVPNPVAPPFYLDNARSRELITSQLAVHPHEFFHNANISSWGFIGRNDLTRTLARRFYAVNKTTEMPWGYVIVPTEEEKSAVDSIYPASTATLPEFTAVTDEMRYRAVGA